MMQLPCSLRSLSQRCSLWPLLKGATCPVVRGFSINFAAQNKKSIAEELGLPQPPTKPLLPFTKYMSMGHREHPHLSWNERVRVLSDKWNQQSPEERAQRLQEYYEEKKEFQLKYKAYLSQLTAEQVKSLEEAVSRRKKAKESANSKREKKKEIERLGRPKHPNNCFILFLSSLKSSDPDATQGHNKEFLAYASAKWKALPEAERRRFKEEGERRMRQYEKDMAAWEQEMIRIGRPELVRKCSSLHTNAPADSNIREKISEGKASPSEPVTQSQVKESSAPLKPNTPFESKEENSLKIYSEERMPRNSINEMSLTTGNLHLGTSNNSNIRENEILPQWHGKFNDLYVPIDHGYEENLDNESLPLDVEDKILNEIESLRLNSQPKSRENDRHHHSLHALPSPSPLFGADKNRNSDQLESW